MSFSNGPKSPQNLTDEQLDKAISDLCGAVQDADKIYHLHRAALAMAYEERKRRSPPKSMFCPQCDDRVGCMFAHPCKHGHDTDKETTT